MGTGRRTTSGGDNSALSKAKAAGGAAMLVSIKGVTPKKQQSLPRTERPRPRPAARRAGGAARPTDAPLYNRNVFCCPFLSFPHPGFFLHVSFGNGQTCSSPHDCACRGERRRSAPRRGRVPTSFVTVNSTTILYCCLYHFVPKKKKRGKKREAHQSGQCSRAGRELAGAPSPGPAGHGRSASEE